MSTEENPYESPTVDELEAAVTSAVGVDGKYLVIPNGAVLPPYCVRTGVPVQPRDMRTFQRTWIPPGQCTFTYGLSAEVWRRDRIRRSVLVALVLLAVLVVSVLVGAGLRIRILSAC